MKKLSNITTVETKAAFRERVVEKFVKTNLPPKMRKESKTAGMGGFANHYKEIEYCAAETPVIGTIDIFFAVNNFGAIRHISQPVTSRFIVFCTREENTDYKVSWSCSLS